MYRTRKISPAERATAIAQEHSRGASWRWLAAKYDVPAGTICRFAKSGGQYIPHHYQEQLGFEAPVMVKVPACRVCGQVHVSKRCTAKAHKPRPEPTKAQAWWRKLPKDLRDSFITAAFENHTEDQE